MPGWWDGASREGRLESEHAWRVPIEKIVDGNYNLDLKNPNRGDDFAHLPPEQLVEDILTKERRIIELLGEIRTVVGEEAPSK